MGEVIERILNERESTHGSWADGARVSQDLKRALRINKEHRPAWVNEALDRICMKLSRIAVGDHLEVDHWKDLQGYARLPEREIGKLITANIAEPKMSDAARPLYEEVGV